MQSKPIFLVYFLLCLSTLPLCAQITVEKSIAHDHPDCTLPLGEFKGKLSVPYEWTSNQKALRRAANFSVDFVTNGTIVNGLSCTTWPTDAMTAFNFALDIWSNLIESSQTINIQACWTTDLATNTLGSAGASAFHGLSGPSVIANTFYPRPLAEALVNFDIGNPDIRCFFNANRTDWYNGTDASPSISQIDFVSVVLHEIGHGLGFAGGSNIDDGNIVNGTECDDVSGNGCVGISSSGNFFPTIYTRFVETDNGTDINSITNPSSDIATLIEGGSISGGSGGLFLNGTEMMAANSNQLMRMHTPSPIVSGSSYSHFDESTYPNALMSPSISAGQAIHDPGLAAQLFYDMGWTAPALPVELLRFEAFPKETSVLLHWTSGNEKDNEGFEIERSNNGIEWTKIGFRSGTNQANQLSNYQFEDKEAKRGRNYYRLRQIDFDGKQARSKIVLAELTFDEAVLNISPVPAHNFIQVEWQDSDRSAARETPFKIFDASGRLIQAGRLEAGTQVIDISTMEKGVFQLVIPQEEALKTSSFIKM
ncbi:MAG: hypothetical protein AAF990_13580 [Bacteroidota bacterium]